ncbi:metal-dependent phosphohydrolase [Clostridium botulinum B2 128]|uniref:HD domain-containing protein n=1 Tax=Clostridium botulinum TaxID=1491 RepID=UPI0007E022AC|nr:ATP-binding protein [Clostridium botulinum]KEI76187.1 metal-dependent phosphohydrolase [Clostridium botulinum B2 128]NFI41327.1 metal-dependent phosphohydrolase [Clostridium botulinum]NFI76459.1 metal-dependent phosphohydrolase [Clostridium botulinum]NFJ36160.1 metal-dependent phosphohydrolase [Clostridium botulinum]NFS21080.1 metal-dependent phosphohydrolase [Clostridium botulinum]
MMDDWLDEIEPRLRKSYIFQVFTEKCANDSAGDHAKALVKDCVFYAYNRSKTIIKHMAEFTLHDSEHLFRVLRLMEKLLSKENIDKLYIPELMLLILTAFFHDIGMAPDEKTIIGWKKYWDINPKFDGVEQENEYKEFEKFCFARPERLKEIDEARVQGNITLSETLKQYLITDYIRITHGKRSREIIEKDWNGKIKYKDIDLTVDFAELCFSHFDDAIKIRNLDKGVMCGQDSFVCLPLLAVILRIADILDFDLKRTPTVLFSHLYVRHPISLQEWSKHRAVEAWNINNRSIQFHANCTHPAIESAIHKFCDLIDKELGVCNNILNEINEFNKNNERLLIVRLPFQVDRIKIQTKKNISGKAIYNYRETRFELSKKQVIDLLMGTKLYGDSGVALRELIQNSIDACLLRKALEDKWENFYEPSIKVKYYCENSEWILEVNDNGIGMDQYIIDTYYSTIGSSFYKSPDFYSLKSETGANFVPTSRFGIGILSCFMVADTMLVETRKLYGPHRSSEPVSLIIEGQDSIFWVKDGIRQIPGTQTKLILRKKENPWQDLTEDQFIKLVEEVVPNPPFTIEIETSNQIKKRDKHSFEKLTAACLKDYSWNKHKNLKEIEVEFNDINEGIVGSAIIGILEKHSRPVEKIEMINKNIDIDGETFELNKSIRMSDNEIELFLTTITIDDDENVEIDESERTLAKSKSRIALHGIEVATTLFPNIWEIKRNQVKLCWPFPMLIILDICDKRDIDLNSARDRIILSDKWLKFEEDLARIICKKIRDYVPNDYWNKLKAIISKTSNKAFLRGLNQVE